MEGTAQGASVSPLLANVYLHYVLDLWAHQWRRRHAHGEVIIVRSPTTTSWVSSTKRTPSGSLTIFVSDSRSLRWSCTRRRRA